MQQYNQFRNIIRLEESSMIRIGEIIKTKRKEQNLTQEDLASCLGVSGAAVSKWENGGMPGVDLFPALSRLFNVSIDYLMMGNGNLDSACDEEQKEKNLDTS